MINQDSFTFLKDLTKNNNREWFHANKKRYEKELKTPFEQTLAAIISRFQKHDPEIQITPKEAAFRIYRDTRFSKDKTPYKTHVSAIISKLGRKAKELPGFYFHLETGRLMMGGGAYFLDKLALQKVRRQIVLQADRFQSIVRAPEFINCYEELKGEKNKRLPKEFKGLDAKQPLIANKQFYAMAELDPKMILASDYLDQAENYFLALQPLNEFLKEAMN